MIYSSLRGIEFLDIKILTLVEPLIEKFIDSNISKLICLFEYYGTSIDT